MAGNVHGPNPSASLKTARRQPIAPPPLAAPERDAPETLLRLNDAAHRLGISRQQLYKLMDRGLVRWVTIPGMRGRRVPRSVIDGLIDRGQHGGWAATGKVTGTS
jgi:predicted DNA-binding transcriptional regulator AlpA